MNVDTPLIDSVDAATQYEQVIAKLNHLIPEHTESSDFYERAACRARTDVNPFPRRGENTTTAEMKAVCAKCPVKGRCLELALKNNEEHGIWGGETYKGRQRIVKARRASATR